MDEGFSGLELARKYTQYMDMFLTGIFNSIDRDARIVLLATGGYGREELAPFSDIDIMFFCEKQGKCRDSRTHSLCFVGLRIGHQPCIQNSG